MRKISSRESTERASSTRSVVIRGVGWSLSTQENTKRAGAPSAPAPFVTTPSPPTDQCWLRRYLSYALTISSTSNGNPLDSPPARRSTRSVCFITVPSTVMETR